MEKQIKRMDQFSFGAVLNILKRYYEGTQVELLRTILNLNILSRMDCIEFKDFTESTTYHLFGGERDVPDYIKQGLGILTKKDREKSLVALTESFTKNIKESTRKEKKQWGEFETVFKEDKVELAGKEQKAYQDDLKSRISKENLIIAIQALRGLINNQVLWGLMSPEEADSLCGTEEFEAGSDYDLNLARLVLWRIIIESMSYNNIKTKEIQVCLKNCFEKSLVPGKTASVLVGRTAEIKEIQTALQQTAPEQNNCVFVTGLPGIGKSKVAEAVMRQTWGRDNVLWLKYEGSIRQTILSMKCCTVGRFYTDDERYKHTMKLLKLCDRELLVVLDNADAIDPEDKDFVDFCQGEYTKLITTRDTWMMAETYTCVDIVALSENELVQVYSNSRQNITNQKSVPAKEERYLEDIKTLIQTVHSNTLMVELVAKWVRISGQSLHMLCEDMQSSQTMVSSDPVPFLVLKQDGNYKRTLEGHLLLLIEKYKFKKIEERMLQMFALLSVHGVPMQSIYKWGDRVAVNVDAILTIVNKGLLIQEEDAEETTYIAMHPMLRDIFLAKYKPASGSFPHELDAVLTEHVQPRGLWIQNIQSITERMQTWEDSNAHTFLQSAFMKVMEYGVEGPAKSIRKHYFQLPDGRKPLSKQVYQSYMDGVLLWKYGKSSDDMLRAERMLRETKKQCEDKEKRRIVEDNVWLRCCLALGEICWESGREDEVQQFLEELVMGLQSWALNDPRLIEEILCAMSRFDKILAKQEDMIPQLLEMGAAMRSEQQSQKMNWLKLNLAFANMARSSKDYDQKAVIWYLDQAIQYGDGHKLEDSIEYREAERLKLNLETELASTEEE